MRSIRTTLAVVMLFLSAGLCAAETERYIVATTRSGRLAVQALSSEVGSLPGRSVREFQIVNGFAADLTAEEAETLRHSAGVRWVRPVVKISINDESSAPLVPTPTAGTRYGFEQLVPWGIDNVHAREAWVASRGAGVHVAVLDTGIDRSHPDLAGHVVGSFDAYGNDPLAKDDNFHGTHVSGTIAATNNSMGVVGVAPEAELWAVKVLDKNGNGTEELLIRGLEFVLQKKREIGGNWIINLSLGANGTDELEEEAFAKVLDQGVLVIASAGNRGLATVDYPARYENMIAVGSIDSNQFRSKFSSYGAGLSITAPGNGVVSTLPVGSLPVTDVSLSDGTVVRASTLTGSPRGEINGTYVYCGLGRPEDFPAGVAGNIAVVRRGEIYFRDKGRNARAAGARALVIISDGDEWDGWTLLPPECDGAGNCSPTKEDVEFPWLLTVSMTKTSGDQLLAKESPITISARYEDYGPKNGTSMAAPHVTGTAAIVWSLAPTATAGQIRNILKLTARDLGTPDWDENYGFGVVDALAAAKYVAPAVFGLPPQPPPVGRRPSAGH